MKKSLFFFEVLTFASVIAVLFQNCAKNFSAIDSLKESGSTATASMIPSNDRSDLIDRMDNVLRHQSTGSIYVTTDNFHPTEELPEGVIPKRPLLHFFTQANSANLNGFLQMASLNSDGEAFSSQGSSGFKGCGQDSPGQLWVYTYNKPYMLSQPAYISWIKSITVNSADKLEDFLPPKARSYNNWLGAKSCPINTTLTSNNSEPDFLKRSLGQSISKSSDDSLVLTLDNRYNPYRWMVPFNETHHVESPSMAFLRRSTPEEKTTTELALANYMKGPTAGALKQPSTGVDEIYLDYDIELLVIDHSSEMKEYQYSDILSSDSHNDFLSEIFIAAKNFGDSSYFSKRLVPKTFQFSLMVNWAEVGATANSPGLYRLSEIMMASQNYQSVLPTDYKLVPTDKPNFDFNPYIVEGGANAAQAWYRAHADGYHNFHPSRGSDYGALYPFSSEFRHQPISNSNPIFMKGSINISKFYKLSRDSGIFPGIQFNPNEVHRIHWVGAIFEAHGPYEVQLKMKKLNLSIQKASKSTEPVVARQAVSRLKSQMDDYLYSTNTDEINSAIAKSGYTLQGPAFSLSVNQTATTDLAIMRCRSGSIHFLSTTANCEGQIVEGILGYASSTYSAGMVRLQRYSKSGGSYLTTLETNLVEISAALSSGYHLDGPQGYAYF